MKRIIVLIAALAAIAATAAVQSGTSSADSGPINAKHFFWAQGTAQAASTQAPARSASSRSRRCT
jgi:hypothetical protein